jgi:hypothetical protein
MTAALEFAQNKLAMYYDIFVVADQEIAGRNKAHCIYIQNKAES